MNTESQKKQIYHKQYVAENVYLVDVVSQTHVHSATTTHCRHAQ